MIDSGDPVPRVGLDGIVDLLRDPGFAARHRRRMDLRQASRHVNPLMLAGASPDSVYVRDWREHASRCRACGRLFRYFGLD